MEFNPRRYAIYTRQSVESSEKTLSSCDVQFSICQDFMQSRAGPLCQWIGERLDDDGHSGATLKRPSVKRLMDLVASGLVDDVVIYRLDRLTRSLRDSVVIFEAFQKARVELLIVTAPELASSASDRLVLNLMGVFAEFERDMVCSRLADTRESLRRHGRRLAGKLPYGYDTDPTSKQLIVNRLEAEHVRWFFKMAADGTLPIEIAAIANQRGWKTKVTVAKRSGRKSGGGFWTPRQILDLLNNPVYLGVFADGDATRPGTHQSIISTEDFEAAGEQIRNRRTTRAARTKPRNLWPLRGKILCPECGRRLSPHSRCKGSIIYRSYRCRSNSGGRLHCKAVSMHAHDAESAVMDAIKNSSCDLPSNSDCPDVALFFGYWQALDECARRLLIPEIVIQVEIRKTTLRIELDDQAMARLGRDWLVKGRMESGFGCFRPPLKVNCQIK